MQEFVIVFATASSRQQAETIARALVDSRAAACVNVVPAVLSIYAWKGETHRDEEALMIVKSTRALFPKVLGTIERLHSYEVPEVIAVPLTALSDKYRAYLGEILGEPR